MSPSSTSDLNFTTHSTLCCEPASVATSSNSNILDPLRPNYLPQPLDRKINKCFLALRPQRYMLRAKPPEGHARTECSLRWAAARGAQGYEITSMAIACVNYMKATCLGYSHNNANIRSTPGSL